MHTHPHAHMVVDSAKRPPPPTLLPRPHNVPRSSGVHFARDLSPEHGARQVLRDRRNIPVIRFSKDRFGAIGALFLFHNNNMDDILRRARILYIYLSASERRRGIFSDGTTHSNRLLYGVRIFRDLVISRPKLPVSTTAVQRLIFPLIFI